MSKSSTTSSATVIERLSIAVGAALVLAGAAAHAGEEDWKTLSAQVQNHLERGNMQQALLFARQALKEAETAWGETHLNTAGSLDTLARVLLFAGNDIEAEIYYRRALAVKEKLFGPDSLTTGHTLKNLALTLDALGRKAEADRMRERVAAIFKTK